MMDQRYPTAIEREKAKIAGVEPSHPADQQQTDPANATLAEMPDEAPKKARLKHMGGSDFDRFNTQIAQSVVETAWIISPDTRTKAQDFAAYALGGIAPQDEIEGMLAAQMIASHQASMECHRRAMHSQQSSDVRALNLKNAAKASQTYAALLECLNKHRSKGQQRVIVEHVHRHVHVHEGGAPIVGHVDAPGGGVTQKIGDQPHAPRLAHSAQRLASMRSEGQEREPVPRAGDEERPVPHARRR